MSTLLINPLRWKKYVKHLLYLEMFNGKCRIYICINSLRNLALWLANAPFNNFLFSFSCLPVLLGSIQCVFSHIYLDDRVYELSKQDNKCNKKLQKEKKAKIQDIKEDKFWIFRNCRNLQLFSPLLIFVLWQKEGFFCTCEQSSRHNIKTCSIP